ncbi:MAG: PTS IIA-like nitrogen regulatory protein PtsN [Rhodospirillaceae bacterium]
MQISDILSPESVVSNLKVTSKKQALQELSKRISDLAELEDRDVFEILLDREKLGTTGVGNGIAIPHGKMENVDKLHGLFARLERPVEFESIDERPVDLIFLLLAPESAGADHLKALAQVSRLLRDKSMCEKLRGSDSPEALYALLTDQTANQAA